MAVLSKIHPDDCFPPSVLMLMRTMLRAALTVLFLFASLNTSAGQLTWTTAGPDTGKVTVVRFDPLAPNVVWAGTIGHGVFRSTDGGVTWSAMNNGLNPGAVGAIVIDPNNSANMWTGHYNIWRSTDGGNHWIASEEGLLPGASLITSMVVDPSHPSNLFVGTTREIVNQSAGVQKSTNGGENWFDSGSAGLSTKDIFALAIDRLNPSTLFAGGLPDALHRPMFKSTDGGTTWFSVSSGLLGETIDAIAIDPLDGARLFAAQAGNLMKTNDGGSSWAPDGAGVPSSCCTAIVYERNSSTNIWLASPEDIYRTTNGGANWTPAKIGNESVKALDVNAEGTLVAGTENDGLFRRTSSTTSWNAANHGFLASDVNSVTADQSTAGTLYAGTQATGIFKSVDHGQSWQRLSPDLLGITIDAITIDPRSSSIIYAAGVGGSGFYKSSDAGATWSSPSFLPSSYAIAIDPSMTDVLYVATNRGVSRSTNGGASFTSVSKGLPSSGGVTALAIDPVNTMNLYAGPRGSGVYKTTDGGANWTKKSPDLNVVSIVVDRTNPANVFITTDGSGIFRSTDGGDTWSAANAGIPTKSTLGLWIDPLDGHRLYASTPLNGVFRSTDAGATWTQLGGVAPAQLIESIAVEPGGDIVHAAASGGVFSYQFNGHVTTQRRRGTTH